MVEFVDYYKVLEISPHATDAVVKAAYRVLSSRYHPDKAEGSVKFMQQVNEAYRILSDPDLRRKYHEKYVELLEKKGEIWRNIESGRFEEKDWNIAIKIYPDLQEYFERLRFYSESTANSYIKRILQEKAFFNREEVFYEMEAKFFEDEFGTKDKKVIDFAKYLYKNRNTKGLIGLKQYVAIFGDDVLRDDHKSIISSIDGDYFKIDEGYSEEKETANKWLLLGLLATIFLVLILVIIEINLGRSKNVSRTNEVASSQPAFVKDNGPTVPQGIGLSSGSRVRINVEFLSIPDIDQIRKCELEESFASVSQCRRDLINKESERFDVAIDQAFLAIDGENSVRKNNLIQALSAFSSGWCGKFEGAMWGPGNHAWRAVTSCLFLGEIFFSKLYNSFLVNGLVKQQSCATSQNLCIDLNNNYKGSKFDAKRLSSVILENSQVVYKELYAIAPGFDQNKKFKNELSRGMAEGIEGFEYLEHVFCDGHSTADAELCRSIVWGYLQETLEQYVERFKL